MKIEDVEEILPDDGRGKVAIRLLDEQQVAIAGAVAQVRQLILAASRLAVARLDLARVGEPQPRLAEQVETDIGRRDVLLEHRAFADPFAEPLREYEVVVAEPEQVVGQLAVPGHR